MKSSVVFVALLTLLFSACEKDFTFFVADHYAIDNSDSPQKCMLLKQHEGDDWTLFCDKIEGFTYEEGYAYKLKVRISKIENPKAGTSPIQYSLIKIISKVQTVQESQNQIVAPKSLDGDWKMTLLEGFENNTGAEPSFSIKDGKISGDNGCNTFGGQVSIHENGMFKVSDLISTKMFCVETAGLEMKFMDALRKAEKYTLDGDALYLYDANNDLLVLMNKKIAEKMSVLQADNYVIKYNIGTRGYNREWTYDGKAIQVKQSRPEQKENTITISEKDQKSIYKLLEGLDLEKLETLEAPSTKHQFDGAKVANLSFTIGDRTYSVPPFDHGNPNSYIKNLVEKLDQLSSE